MFYRVALGLGLLLLGAYIGRELTRTRPIRTALQERRNETRPTHVEHPATPRRNKISLH